MGIFGKLFGSEKLKVNDSDFGELESFFMKGNRVGWLSGAALSVRPATTDLQVAFI